MIEPRKAKCLMSLDVILVQIGGFDHNLMAHLRRKLQSSCAVPSGPLVASSNNCRSCDWLIAAAVADPNDNFAMVPKKEITELI
jgi:hypothetical protein